MITESPCCFAAAPRWSSAGSKYGSFQPEAPFSVCSFPAYSSLQRFVIYVTIIITAFFFVNTRFTIPSILSIRQRTPSSYNWEAGPDDNPTAEGRLFYSRIFLPAHRPDTDGNYWIRFPPVRPDFGSAPLKTPDSLTLWWNVSPEAVFPDLCPWLLNSPTSPPPL